MARPENKPLELRGFPRALMARCFKGESPVGIVWVEDGDSVKAMVDNGRGSYDLEDLRLFGIDAPDAGKNGMTAADERASQENLAELLGFDLEAAERGEWVVAHGLVRTAPGSDKYGRWLVWLESEDGAVVNDAQVAQGFAVYRDY